MFEKAVKRFVGVDVKDYGTVKPYSETRILNNFAIFLINKIDDNDWQQMFEACVPLLIKSTEFMHMLIPYLIYFAMRFNERCEPDELTT